MHLVVRRDSPITFNSTLWMKSSAAQRRRGDRDHPPSLGCPGAESRLQLSTYYQFICTLDEGTRYSDFLVYICQRHGT